jgi:dihydropteroate synthase
LVLDRTERVAQELERIGVDLKAYPLFINKAHHLVVKFEGLSCAQATILKQTALICGADVAIPKHAYRGSRRKNIAAILFANNREIEKIEQRLVEQPWMDALRLQLSELRALEATPILNVGRKKFTFNRTHIMGVINTSPDSFYSGSHYTTTTVVEKVASSMEEEGADFIDIGAESTRPGARALDAKEEIERLKKVLPTLIKCVRIPVSVDTYKSTVAAFAIDEGARIINDISGLGFDKKMVKVIAKNRVSVVIMHIKGVPKTMQVRPHYDDLMAEIYQYLSKRIDRAVKAGIKKERIIIDPGLGFGKRLNDNYEIIERLGELSVFNRPIMAGHSRKSFIGKPFNLDPEQRLEGTLGVETLLIKNGASILRVHDVGEAKKVALLIDGIVR